MPITATILFSRPQQEVASILRDQIRSSRSIHIVSGFATVEGVNAIFPDLTTNINKLKRLIIGAGTYRAYEMMDQLLDAGASAECLRVHLGHTRNTSRGARHSFYRYHPMLHSKIYYFEFENGTASAFIGSHNLTGFALHGLNGEAGVLIQGDGADPQMLQVRSHIEECLSQSVPYSPNLKEAFSWWSLQFIEGLREKVNDTPRDGEAKLTIIVLGELSNGIPSKDDVIYFEIPAALGQIQSLQAEVHIYIFDQKPSTAEEALGSLSRARASLWCQTLGLEKEQGGVELRADWQVISSRNPIIAQVTRPFRPTTSPGMQQVRVKVRNNVYEKYEYLFSGEKSFWEPQLDNKSIQISETEIQIVKKLELVPPEDKEWFLVTGLKSIDGAELKSVKEARLLTSPEGGGFILFSRRRRKKR